MQIEMKTGTMCNSYHDMKNVYDGFVCCVWLYEKLFAVNNVF